MERFHVAGRYFWDIFVGRKIYEGRSGASRMLKSITIGDVIEFYQETSSGDVVCYQARIFSRTMFKSVKKMLETQGILNMLPGTYSIEEGINIYAKFGLTEEEAKKNGAYAVGINVISDIYVRTKSKD